MMVKDRLRSALVVLGCKKGSFNCSFFLRFDFGESQESFEEQEEDDKGDKMGDNIGETGDGIEDETGDGIEDETGDGIGDEIGDMSGDGLCSIRIFARRSRKSGLAEYCD